MNFVFKSRDRIFKYPLVLPVLVLFCLSQCIAQEEYDEDGTKKKPKANQGADFFGEGQGKQDFFAGRNLSSNSVFNGESSNLNLSPVIEPIQSPKVDIQPQQPEQSSDSFVAKPNQEINAAEDKQSSAPEEDQNNSPEPTSLSANETNSNSNLDPNLRDVMEHSRKIREAIFGEEGARNLPVSIRQRLQDKAPQGKQEGTRF